MILICGADGFNVSTLPEADVMDYQLKPSARANMFVRTVGTKAVHIYLSNAVRDLCAPVLNHELSEKTTFFDTPDDLVRVVSQELGVGAPEPVPVEEPVVDASAPAVFEPEPVVVAPAPVSPEPTPMVEEPVMEDTSEVEEPVIEDIPEAGVTPVVKTPSTDKIIPTVDAEPTVIIDDDPVLVAEEQPIAEDIPTVDNTDFSEEDPVFDDKDAPVLSADDIEFDTTSKVAKPVEERKTVGMMKPSGLPKPSMKMPKKGVSGMASILGTNTVVVPEPATPATSKAITALEAMLEEKRDEVNTLRDEVERVTASEKAKRDELQGVITELRSELESVKAAQTSNLETDNSLQAQLDEITKALNLKATECSKLQHEAETSTTEIVSLRNQLETLNRERDTLVQQIAELKQALEDAASDNNVDPQEVADLKARIQSIQANADTTTQQYQAEIERLNTELSAQSIRVNSQYAEMEKMRNLHEKELNDFRSQVSGYQEEINRLEMETSGDLVQMSKLGYYDGFSSVPRAIIREELRPDEKEAIEGYVFSNFSIFSFGPHISMYTALADLKNSIFGKVNALVVDCTCDLYLATALGIAATDNGSENLETANIGSLVQNCMGVEYIPCDAVHDVAYLAMNWGIVLKKLYDYANGRPVIILLGSISSFVHRLLCSKLGTLPDIQNCLVIAGDPYVIRNTYTYLAYIPEDRVNLVATQVAQASASLLEPLKAKYSVAVYPKSLDFSQLL